MPRMCISALRACAARAASLEHGVDEGTDRRTLRQDEQAAEDQQHDQHREQPPLLARPHVAEELFQQRSHRSAYSVERSFSGKDRQQASQNWFFIEWPASAGSRATQ